MSVKIEREKVLTFKFESEMMDQGTYSKSFIIKRKNTGLDLQVARTKAILTGGQTPITRGEMQLVDTIAVLMNYFTLLDSKGKPVVDPDGTNATDWIDEILDQKILFALHKEWFDYQESFLPKVGATNETPAAPEAPVQS